MTCACGCGEETRVYRGRSQKYVRGHHMRRPEYAWIRLRGNAGARSGEDHPNWKGGISCEARRQRKGVVCERCGFVPEHPCQLHLHRHAEPDAETLCANCHWLCGHYEKTRGLRNVPWRVAAPLGAERG